MLCNQTINNTSNITQNITADELCLDAYDFNNITEMKILKFGLNGIATLIICILGIIGNGLTIAVLRMPKMCSSNSCYLKGLAFWDILVLVNTIFLITLPLMSDQFLYKVFPYVVVYVYPLALVSQTATLWITVALTLERYIAVCKPFQAKSMCTISRARKIIVIISICSFIFNICRWFEYEITEVQTSENGHPSKHLAYQYTKFGSNHIFQQTYFIWLYSIILFLVPVSILTIFNSILIYKIKESEKMRKEMIFKNQQRENNVTKIAVAVVTLYILCHIPALIYNVAYAIDTDNINKMFEWQVLSSVRNFLVPFNSAINFILFSTLGNSFQKSFKQKFCFCFCKTKNKRTSTISQPFYTEIPLAEMSPGMLNKNQRICRINTQSKQQQNV